MVPRRAVRHSRDISVTVQVIAPTPRRRRALHIVLQAPFGGTMTVPLLHHPVFGTLTPEESWAVLRRNHVGRLCFINHGAVDIEPVHYVLGDARIILRSAAGTKLGALAHNPYVAFEVDEIDGTFDWRSVIARGTVYVADRDGSPIERRAFARGVSALRAFVPETLRPGDPTPMRSTVYAIYVDAITGRIAVPDPSVTAW
jgi:hypothetical protein